jgi:hypothetical protein
VSGNLTLQGTSSYLNISSSQVNIGSNTIILNTYAPFERFAGLAVYDSGSNVGVTGSLLWDSTNNVWLYTHPDVIGSVASARLISGPLNTGSLGSELGLTTNVFPIAGGDDHIQDSLFSYTGGTFNFNGSVARINATTGDLNLSGQITAAQSGSVDAGSTSSRVLFRNSSNVYGYVSASVGSNVTTGFLGYNVSNGALQFSDVIDGGTF